MVAVLKGSAIFLADLVRTVDLPLSFDFMSISSYGPTTETSGRVRIVKDLDRDIGGRDVLIVEDIIDTGLTASYLISTLESRDPASVGICTLLDKSVRRIVPLPIKFSGFDCPDKFVVGYGLDYEQRYRNLGFIVAVNDFSALEADPDCLAPLIGNEPAAVELSAREAGATVEPKR
jgi:hypoxanthine phosphoribosyltransferase